MISIAARTAAPAGVTAPRVGTSRASRVAFAATMVGLGIVGLVHGDFALVWQRIPIEHLPGRATVAYATAIVELLGGIGLLLPAMATLASRVMFVFLFLWLVLLKLPAVVAVPTMEATWLGFGEVAVMFAGAWILFADDAANRERAPFNRIAGDDGIRAARFLFAVSLPMIGLSHFFYPAETAAFVPAWLPFTLVWVYLTGAGSLAACGALLLGVWPRLAATLEAAMLGTITLLVWGANLLAKPADRTTWTGFLISGAIACGAWVVADSYRESAWLSIGRTRPRT